MPASGTEVLNCARDSRHHDDVIKWKHFVCYWPFVRGIQRSPVDSLHSDAGLWWYLWSAPEQTIGQIIETPVISDAIAPILTSLLWCCATFGWWNSSFRAEILASPFCPTSQAFDQLLVTDESMDFKYYHGIPLTIEQQIPSQIARNSHTYASLDMVNEQTCIIRPGRQ